MWPWFRPECGPDKNLTGRSPPSSSKMNEHFRRGNSLLSFAWYQIATRIVERAIRIYDLGDEQAEALRKVFLRPNDYIVN